MREMILRVMPVLMPALARVGVSRKIEDELIIVYFSVTVNSIIPQAVKADFSQAFGLGPL